MFFVAANAAGRGQQNALIVGMGHHAEGASGPPYWMSERVERMGKQRPQYTDEFRAEAVVLLEAEGYPNTPGAISAVAARLGLYPRTLSRWARRENNPPPVELMQEKRGELVEALKGLVDLMVAEMQTAIPGAGLRELATSFGIVFDKIQLLEGKPTNRGRIQIEIVEADDSDLA